MTPRRARGAPGPTRVPVRTPASRSLDGDRRARSIRHRHRRARPASTPASGRPDARSTRRPLRPTAERARSGHRASGAGRGPDTGEYERRGAPVRRPAGASATATCRREVRSRQAMGIGARPAGHRRPRHRDRLPRAAAAADAGEPVPLKRLRRPDDRRQDRQRGPTKALVKRVRKGQVGGVIVLTAERPDARQQDTKPPAEAAAAEGTTRRCCS